MEAQLVFGLSKRSLNGLSLQPLITAVSPYWEQWWSFAQRLCLFLYRLRWHRWQRVRPLMQVWSPGQEDPQEEAMPMHSSMLAWKSPWAEEPGRVPSKRPQTLLSVHMCAHTRTHTHTNHDRALCRHAAPLAANIPESWTLHTSCPWGRLTKYHFLIPTPKDQLGETRASSATAKENKMTWYHQAWKPPLLDFDYTTASRGGHSNIQAMDRAEFSGAQPKRPHPSLKGTKLPGDCNPQPRWTGKRSFLFKTKCREMHSLTERLWQDLKVGWLSGVRGGTATENAWPSDAKDRPLHVPRKPSLFGEAQVTFPL